MITESLITAFDAVVLVAVTLLPDLPTLTLPSAAGIGGVVGAVDMFIPVGDLAAAFAILVVLIPVWLGYRVFSWVWNHVPMIAGFGLGGKS